MEQAQTAALDAANIDAADADISSATLSEVAGVTCYKVEFTSGNHTYAYSINAESGEVLEASYRDKNAAPTDSAQTDTTASGATTTPAQTTPNINTSTGAVDEAKAQEIALAHAGVKAADATITKSKLDYDDGRQVYEIEWYANGAKYDYEIDAATGKIELHPVPEHQHQRKCEDQRGHGKADRPVQRPRRDGCEYLQVQAGL